MAFNVIPFSSTTIWRKIKARTFPAPKKISPSIVAFRCRDIREWSRDPPNYIATQKKEASDRKEVKKHNTQQEQRNEK
jgi:hypothetical protein